MLQCWVSGFVRDKQKQCRVMVLENMVDAASVDDELEDEVADECSKFGHVTRVTVSIHDDIAASYEEPINSTDDDDDDVKIYVYFTLQSGINNCQSLHAGWGRGGQCCLQPGGERVKERERC